MQNSSQTKIILITVAFIGFVMLAASTGAALRYTGQPGFCINCHLMESYYNSWSKSSHQPVQCNSCHTDSGAAGMIRAKIGGIQQVYTTVMNYKVVPRDKKVYERCLNCHDKVRNSKSSSHGKHLKKGIQCSACHLDLVHNQQKGITMEACIDCHKQEGNPAPVEKCNQCHSSLKRIRPVSHRTQDWQVSHGQRYQQKKQDCLVCHKQGVNEVSCQKCHQTAMPHPQGWAQQHTGRVVAQGKGACLNCHRQDQLPRRAKTCQQCHGVAMPHPENWVIFHGRLGNQQKCLFCHSPSNPVNPGAHWASLEFCTGCHRKNKPHMPNWLAEHGKQRLNRETCALCHDLKQSCQICHAKLNIKG